MAKSQIDFLNSVIVDMQRKNQALMCKVEVLEIGVPANEADDYTQFVTFNSRIIDYISNNNNSNAINYLHLYVINHLILEAH